MLVRSSHTAIDGIQLVAMGFVPPSGTMQWDDAACDCLSHAMCDAACPLVHYVAAHALLFAALLNKRTREELSSCGAGVPRALAGVTTML